MGSFQDLYEEINRGDGDLANTLRKAKVLTNTLQSPPGFDDWIDSELNGYTDPEIVPDYRRFSPASFGDFYSPLREPVYGLQILTDSLPTEVKDFAENVIINESVESLQARLEEIGENELRPWPPEMVTGASEATKLSEDLVLHNAYQQIPALAFSEILNQVKNKLLDFLLRTASEYDTPENTDPPEATADPAVIPEAGDVQVTNVHNTNYNFGNLSGHAAVVIADQAEQEINTNIVQNDIESLLAYYREQGVVEDDLQELKEAVSSEPQASPDGKYGPKVRAWLGNMVHKAAVGVLEIAPKALMKGVNDFYGIWPQG